MNLIAFFLASYAIIDSIFETSNLTLKYFKITIALLSYIPLLYELSFILRCPEVIPFLIVRKTLNTIFPNYFLNLYNKKDEDLKLSSFERLMTKFICCDDNGECNYRMVKGEFIIKSIIERSTDEGFWKTINIGGYQLINNEIYFKITFPNFNYIYIKLNRNKKYYYFVKENYVLHIYLNDFVIKYILYDKENEKWYWKDDLNREKMKIMNKIASINYMNNDVYIIKRQENKLMIPLIHKIDENEKIIISGNFFKEFLKKDNLLNINVKTLIHSNYEITKEDNEIDVFTHINKIINGWVM